MKEDIYRGFQLAGERYQAAGVDVKQALAALESVPLSIHCWQGDDVGGFETPDAQLTGGGIQVTGNYPGKARNLQELQQDLTMLYTLLPGSHRLNLHAIYGDFGGKRVDRDRIEPRHYRTWLDWAGKQGIKLDFNATCFSHPLAESGFTLSSREPRVRDFWIEHVKRAREVSAYLGQQQQSPCLHNLWIPDGSKDLPADRLGCRKQLAASLDRIYAKQFDPGYMKDAVESKLFGIGSEAFVVGSHEFYLAYALQHKLIYCLDLGHFHPTEQVADKISALLPFTSELLLHVSRGVRWDSDHVVILNDEVRLLCQELVRSGCLRNIHLALDFFDATLNRIGAWALGARSTLKALLLALLEPAERLRQYEAAGDFFARLALLEELKALPFGLVWDYYCLEHNCPPDRELLSLIQTYEKGVLSQRT